jgi:isoquinoline 1-oxidoreductase
VPLDAIDMVMGDTDRCVPDEGTWGSLTTRVFGPALRAAGAQARAILVQLASERLGVPAGRLTAAAGAVSAADGRRVTYGQLAKGQSITHTLDERAVLRSVAELRVMGQSPLRLDARDKVTGAAKYAGDLRPPGLLYARLLRPPAHGAKLVRADTAAAARLPGVTVVSEPGLVAVLHADPEAAERALAGVKAEWTPAPPGADQDGIFDELRAKAAEPRVREMKGSPLDSTSGRRFEHTYVRGYVAHAPIEPHAATATFEGGRLTVWASTQAPFLLREQLASALGLDRPQIRVITPYVGGAFGGKAAANRQAEEAARLAQITGRPVQVVFTRAEEFFHDALDPAGIVKIASAVSEDGRITLWDYDVYFAGDRAAELFYDVPHARRRVFDGRGAEGSVHRFATGPWRAPGAGLNVWARESQIDVMAAALRLDPLEFRLRNTTDERMRRCLQEAARKFGWTPAPGPSGRGWGIACGVDSGTYAALMAEVKVDRERGTVAVERVVCAQDMGLVVNPLGATMQVEGSITMGLGYAFSEELRFRGGEVVTENFDTYAIPRFSVVPRAIETVLVKNDALSPQGGGEPAIVPVGGVMANAVFDATGVRLFRLPMTPERLRAALGTHM